MATKKLKLVLCWHMHQPWYRESLDGDYRLPWVYLHALKDYSDMVAHLESHPHMRAVVNFTPVLLEQLDHYAQQIRHWLDTGQAMADPMLNVLAGVNRVPKGRSAKLRVISECLRAHAPRMIEPHAAFMELLAPVWRPGLREPEAGMLPYLNAQYFLDLLTWYHLAWLGHSLKRDPRVKRLMRQGRLTGGRSSCR